MTHREIRLALIAPCHHLLAGDEEFTGGNLAFVLGDHFARDLLRSNERSKPRRSVPVTRAGTTGG